MIRRDVDDCEHEFEPPRIWVDRATGKKFEVRECRHCLAGSIRCLDPRDDTMEWLAQRLNDLGCLP